MSGLQHTLHFRVQFISQKSASKIVQISFYTSNHNGVYIGDTVVLSSAYLYALVLTPIPRGQLTNSKTATTPDLGTGALIETRLWIVILHYTTRHTFTDVAPIKYTPS